MSACPDPARLSAAASGEDVSVEAHAASCASCRDTLSTERALRALAGNLPAYIMSTDRRRALEASIVAHAERGLTPPRRSRRGRILLAAALLAAAAAALVAWRALPASPNRPPPPPPSVAAPQPPPSPPPVVVPLSLAPPTLTPSTGARFDRHASADRDLITITEGTLSVDASASQAVELSDKASTSVRGDGAQLEVHATGGAIHSVHVYAGSVEISHAGRTIVVTAGATWTAPAKPTVRLPDKPTITAALPERDAPPITNPTAFADGWRAYRANDLPTAIDHFARATSDPSVAEDATYWLAASHARAGHTALAITTYDRFLTTFPSSPHTGAAHLALSRLLPDPALAAHHRAIAAQDPDPRIRAAATQ